MALKGLKVLEFSGLAPVPFCGMILSDFGASVVKIERPKDKRVNLIDGLSRGKRSIALDISKPNGIEVVKKLSSQYDVLLDPFRPGVLEKLGLGPKILHGLNPALIYARISGYGQTGPLAYKAGHDINYLAMSGLLSVLGHSDKNPSPPINLLGDFAGGGLLCALGICAALIERSKTGKGQVVDTSMSEGAAYVGSFIWTTQFPPKPLDMPLWGKPRGENLLDGGFAFYQTYKTKDNRYMAVGSLEPKFYQAFLKGLELNEEDHFQFGDQKQLQKIFQDCFSSKTQSEWVAIYEDLDACVTPVLSLMEASEHPQQLSRKAFVSKPNICPSVVPRLSSNCETSEEAIIGEHTIKVLEEAGYNPKEIQELLKDGVAETGEEKLYSKL